MHPNEKLIERFYTCFRNLDGKGMADCYHDNVEFSDPVFTCLKKTDAGNMWKMLCKKAENLEIEFRDIQADDEKGYAWWQADYVFSATGRKVVNRIHAEFHFKEGEIIRHRDNFSFYQWSCQALGLSGRLLGWTPFLKRKVRKMALNGLKKFSERNGGK